MTCWTDISFVDEIKVERWSIMSSPNEVTVDLEGEAEPGRFWRWWLARGVKLFDAFSPSCLTQGYGIEDVRAYGVGGPNPVRVTFTFRTSDMAASWASWWSAVGVEAWRNAERITYKVKP